MKGLSGFVQRYGVIVAFLILFIGTAVWQPENFLRPENLRNLLSHNAQVGIIAVGMTLVIIAGGIDLSVGSMMALAAALGLVVLNKMIDAKVAETTAIAVAAFATVFVGGVLGAFNGFLVTVGRVAPFVATLVGLVAFRSFTLAIADGGQIVSRSSKAFEGIGNGGIPIPGMEISPGNPLLFQWPALLFILSAVFASFLLNSTKFGRYAIAVGANERAATYSAVATGATKFYTYLLLGLFTGLAALTLSSRMNSVATSSMGLYYELDAIAAVVIGGTSLRGGSGRIWGTVVGVLMLGVITNMLILLNVSVYWQGVVKGAIILAAVLIQRSRTS